jgi:hypothetical protein
MPHYQMQLLVGMTYIVKAEASLAGAADGSTEPCGCVIDQLHVREGCFAWTPCSKMFV